jgi:molecular chaperone DnaK (HSP70)
MNQQDWLEARTETLEERLKLAKIALSAEVNKKYVFLCIDGKKHFNVTMYAKTNDRNIDDMMNEIKSEISKYISDSSITFEISEVRIKEEV